MRRGGHVRGAHRRQVRNIPVPAGEEYPLAGITVPIMISQLRDQDQTVGIFQGRKGEEQLFLHVSWVVKGGGVWKGCKQLGDGVCSTWGHPQMFIVSYYKY